MKPFCSTCFLEKPCEILHCDYKKKWREWITLFEPPHTFERFPLGAIDVYYELYRSYTCQYRLCEDRGKMQTIKNVPYKYPVDRVKSFIEVHFHHTAGCHMFMIVASGHILVEKHIEEYFLPLDECTLFFTNEGR